MDRYAFGWVDGWIAALLDWWIGGLLDRWMVGLVDGWMVGFLDWWMVGLVEIANLNIGRWKLEAGGAGSTKIKEPVK